MTSGTGGAHSPVAHATLTSADGLGEHLSRAYGASVVTECAGSAPRRHRVARSTFGSFAIDHVIEDADVELRSGGLNSTVILWVVTGRVECDVGGRTGSAGPGELLLLSIRSVPVSVRLIDASVVVVGMASSVFAGVGDDPVPVRFAGMTPRSPALARVWKQTVTYVRETVLSEPEAATPMVLGAAARLLVGAALAAFPNDAGGPAGPDRSALPTVLRSAMEFVDQNAGRNIGVADIAKAAYVTPRRIQYVFRQHLQTTPTGYVRDVRLRRAYADLLATERSTTTVTATAARWRFTHMGRFAVLYRQTFGESPHETLRRDGPSDR